MTVIFSVEGNSIKLQQTGVCPQTKDFNSLEHFKELYNSFLDKCQAAGVEPIFTDDAFEFFHKNFGL